jgi:hypothetical protein
LRRGHDGKRIEQSGGGSKGVCAARRGRLRKRSVFSLNSLTIQFLCHTLVVEGTKGMIEVGEVQVSWRESGRWHRAVLRPEPAPLSLDERREDLRRSLVWRGVPLVDAYMRACKAA